MQDHAMTARRLYLLAAVFCLAAGAALAIDLPVAAYCRSLQDPQHSLSGIVRSFLKLVLLAEVFAHGAGATAILVTVFVLDPVHRRRLPRTVAVVVVAAIVGHVSKALVARWRPSQRVVETVWESFGGWVPWLVSDSLGAARVNDLQSFPSGHSITAVALAIGLTALYPRGRWLFAVFAVLAVMQRVLATAHYPSDTLASAVVACLVAGALFDSRLAGRWFDRHETLSVARRSAS